MRDRERVDSPDDADEPGSWVVVFDLVSSAGAVVLVAGLLFAISGIWPPLVAIESGSMEPHIQTNDLVFVMNEGRFAGPGSHGDTGVVTARAGARTGYVSFEQHGDVIVYAPDGNARVTPIIHRAMFWVEDGENWYDEANERYIGGADNCEELANCPADHSGFVTKGDWNQQYDQVGRDPLSGPVKPAWIVGTAEARVPWLGQIRLRIGGALQANGDRSVVAENVATTANRTISATNRSTRQTPVS
jgi:signal peptidase